MRDRDQVESRYRQFADVECRGYSELYFGLSNAVADDRELVEFIARMPVIQPNLFFASIQFLTGPDDFPRCGDDLRTFVRSTGDQLERLMKSRRTQTNEIGRCAVILPALPEGPLALLEVGASAGLCLLLDCFSYDYGVARLDTDSSAVSLRCEVKGSLSIPDAMPQIVWRAGLDIDPVDLSDNRDVRWLLSCVWADHTERRQRLAAAIELAQARKMSVLRGDLLSDLPMLLTEVPRNARLVVFHSAVLGYVRREDRPVFAEALANASKKRQIVWISNEAPGIVPEIASLAPPLAELRFLLGRTRFTNGDREDELLALSHPHGSELEWLQSQASLQ